MNETAMRSGGTSAVVSLAVAVGVAGSLIFSVVAFSLLIAALLVVCLLELHALLRTLRVTPSSAISVAVLVALCAIGYRGPEALLAWTPGVVAACVVATFALLIAGQKVEGALPALVSTIASAIYIGVAGSFLIAMRRTAYGFRVALLFTLMVCAHEAAYLIVNKTAGRHPLAKNIQDSSWEGVAAAAAVTSLVAGLAVATLRPPFQGFRPFMLAAIVSLAMPLGKLAGSVILREAAKTHFGRLLRRPGGALDRLDGILFSAPLFYLAYRAMIR